MRAVVNTAEMPTGDMVRSRDADLAIPGPPARDRAGDRRRQSQDHRRERAGGDAARRYRLCQHHHARLCLAGWTGSGSLPALLRAIELNGVAVERNKQAFAWGRIARADPDFLPKPTHATPTTETLDEMIARRSVFLAEYQNRAYAARYEAMVARVRRAESALASEALTEAVARSLFKLMAYKDEYEVARLHMEHGFP